MKKQIFVIILAMIALGVQSLYGQATQGSAPRPLTDCNTGPLNPIAGIPYDYQATVTPEGGSAFWYATLSTQFMDNGARVASVEAIGGSVVAAANNYATTISPANNPLSTSITWTSAGLAGIDNDNPLFVVIEYTQAGDCTNNNMKVYRIRPVNAFQVNIRNLGRDYDANDHASCFDDVQSASYNLTSGEVEYDFGMNRLAFEVVAANFTDSYTPSFLLTGLINNQTAELFWSYTNDFATATSLGAITNGSALEGAEVTTNESNTELGVSIYVWVEVSHNDFEGLADTPITLAVAGLNAANQPNVRWNDCSIDVNLLASLGETNAPDFATHTLNPRPTIESVDPLNFEPNRTP